MIDNWIPNPADEKTISASQSAPPVTTSLPSQIDIDSAVKGANRHILLPLMRVDTFAFLRVPANVSALGVTSCEGGEIKCRQNHFPLRQAFFQNAVLFFEVFDSMQLPAVYPASEHYEQ